MIKKISFEQKKGTFTDNVMAYKYYCAFIPVYNFTGAFSADYNTGINYRVVPGVANS